MIRIQEVKERIEFLLAQLNYGQGGRRKKRKDKRTAQDVAKLVGDLVGMLGPVGSAGAQQHHDLAPQAALEEHDRTGVVAADADRLELELFFAVEVHRDFAGGGFEHGEQICLSAPLPPLFLHTELVAFGGGAAFGAALVSLSEINSEERQ